jgi:drug/metabolite transporter (DMT)-like permease
LHLIIGSTIFYLTSLLTIIAANYAILAQVNFGVIASCISLSTPMNCLLSYIFYQEKLTQKMMIGTSVLFLGIVWVALAKANPIVSEVVVDEEMRGWYRTISIGAAIMIGVLNSVRTVHAKYANVTHKYSPRDFNTDQGLLTGMFCLIASIIYFYKGTPSYTWYNLMVNFAASFMRMLCASVALNCMVKGLAGPTSALIQSNTVIQIAMNSLFLGLIPSFSQLCGSILTLSGVALLILYR